MQWNWQKKDWPEFQYRTAQLQELETRFLHTSGILLGAFKHIGEEDKSILLVDLMSDEAFTTSKIEGEILNRESVQSSIRRNFGLETEKRKILPAEQGVAEMMVDLYSTFDEPLTEKMIFRWHDMLMRGRGDLNNIGSYRIDNEPMQIISGSTNQPKIHFEAPPPDRLNHEVNCFIDWFNKTSSQGKEPLPALTRAGIAHLYFVCLHPFEDGNGRISRAIAQKVLAQSLRQPLLIALSHIIEAHRKAYYKALDENNRNLEITEWLLYFGETVIEAQYYTERMIDFLIEKTRLYDQAKERLNDRQSKVIARMFREGLEGFKGGLSAENYIRITGTSRATATRDLQDLVEIGILKKTGERKSTRYFLNIRQSQV
jgi:Fic family protein